MLMRLLRCVVEKAEGAVAAAGLVALGYGLSHAHAHSQQVGLGVGGQDRPEDDGGLLLGAGARSGFVEERGDLSLGWVGGGAGEGALGSMGGHDAGRERGSETCMSWVRVSVRLIGCTAPGLVQSREVGTREKVSRYAGSGKTIDVIILWRCVWEKKTGISATGQVCDVDKLFLKLVDPIPGLDRIEERQKERRFARLLHIRSRRLVVGVCCSCCRVFFLQQSICK